MGFVVSCSQGRRGVRVPRFASGSVALAFTLTWLAAAATPAAAADGPAAASAASAEPVPEDEYGRGSPRGAMRGYLAACRERDFEKAAEYLDLRGSNGDGPTLARQLRIVLARALFVDVDGLSKDAVGQLEDGLSPNRDRIGTVKTRKGKVDLLLQRVKGPEGVRIWKVAASTVALVPELYDEFGYGALERFLPPVFFELQILEVPLWQWIAVLALVVLAAILSWIVTVALVWLLRPFVRRTDTSLDDNMLERSTGPVRLALAAIIFALGVVPLGLGVGAQAFLGALLRGIFILALTWLAMRLADAIAERIRERLRERGEPGAMGLVPPGRKIVKAIVWLLALVAILDGFGFSVAALVASLGVGGIAVALAAQKTVENLFGGVSLYADRPVSVGDFCRFGDKVGTVEEIGMRSTRVRTLDRTVISIPNAEFANLQLENFGKRDRMRFFTTLGVRYETTPEQLRYILIEIRKLLYAHERVAPDPARIRFVGFGAYSLDLEIFAYVETADWSEFLGIREDLLLRIMDVVEASGTGFAFPSQTLYVGRDEGMSDQRVEEVTQEVQRWRERREIYLPEFPPERIAELAKSVSFPAEGAPLREPSQRAG